MIDDRTNTSFHEAGHSVACAVLGGRVIDADIIQTTRRDGQTHYCPPGLCENQIAIILAGDLAVWELDWRGGNKYREVATANDFEKIDELQRRWYHGEPPANREDCICYQQGEALALETIASFWGAIETVAAWLLKHDTIRGAMVHTIVARHKERANSFQEKT